MIDRRVIFATACDRATSSRHRKNDRPKSVLISNHLRPAGAHPGFAAVYVLLCGKMPRKIYHRSCSPYILSTTDSLLPAKKGKKNSKHSWRDSLHDVTSVTAALEQNEADCIFQTVCKTGKKLQKKLPKKEENRLAKSS